MAGVGFVAAQAGSFDFFRLELMQHSKSGDASAPIHLSLGGNPKSYSHGSPDQAPGAGAAARLETARAAALSFSSLGSAQGSAGAGQATSDGDLFQLPSFAIPAGFPGSQDSGWFGRRSGSSIGGPDGVGGLGHGSSGGGSPRGRSQNALAECCGDDAAVQSTSLLADPPLTAPLLNAVVLGPVPETATWAMMILGIGLSGVVLRARRRILPA